MGHRLIQVTSNTFALHCEEAAKQQKKKRRHLGFLKHHFGYKIHSFIGKRAVYLLATGEL